MSDGVTRYRPRVLVVEDNQIIAEDLQQILEDCECEAVGICSTVKAGFEALGSLLIDVAIVDYHLADGSSEALGLALDSKSIPYAMLSGQSSDTLQRVFPNTPILTKPYTPNDVQDVVDRLMAARLKG